MTRRPALLVALLSFAALSQAGCAELARLLRGGVQTPTATYQSSRLDSISLDDATIAATFEISNPNPIALSLAGVDWGFSLDAQKILDGRFENGIQLAANGKTMLTVPVKVPFASIPGLLSTLATKSEAPYAVDARVGVKTPIGLLSLPIRWTGQLPIPKLPKVSLTTARVDNLSFSGARVLLSLSVTNPNVFALPLQSINGNFLVANQSVAKLGLNASKPLPAGVATLIELPVEISFANAGFAVSSAIASKSAGVSLKGEANVAGKIIPLDLSGTLR